MTGNAVFDASAVLAVFFDEPGGDAVRDRLRHGTISAVNYAEILARLTRFGVPLDELKHQVDRYQFNVVHFDSVQAVLATSLLPVTKTFGLSFADRACLSLALHRQAKVFTADRVWTQLSVDLDVECVR